METQVLEDPTVRDRLYRHFPYLQDVAEFDYRGMLLEEATSLGWLHTDDFLGLVLGYPTEPEMPSPTKESFLSAEDNSKLVFYRHLSPVLPWPQPTIGVRMSGDSGHVTGMHKVDVVLKRMGQAQLCWGAEVGVLWEAFLDQSVQHRQDFEALMNQFWAIAEGFLAAQGVERIYTLSHDPEYDPDWYPGFLQRRGYAPGPGQSQAVVKRRSRSPEGTR